LSNGDDWRLDPSVVAALYLEHANELRRFLVGVLRDRELANEVLQIAFAKAVERGHTAERESLKAWLFRVALNEALAVRRKQDVRLRAWRKIAWAEEPGDESPVDRLCREETIERVRTGLRQLPSEQRRVVEMRIYEEKTFATIAQELGVPLGTVLSRMQLALRKLRQKLGTED
jgi:RNA polymerase sigma-70 factor (ECF subfamily)